MADAKVADLKRTPLYECHKAAGAKLVDFAGWEMPVQYSGLMDEHQAVRQAAGLFDVSHMGEVHVTGAGAEAYLQHLTPNDVTKLLPGRAHYSALLNERGTYLDDLLVYRLAADEFLVVVNASNVDSDFAWMAAQPHPGCSVVNASNHYALLALQGPKAVEILQRHTRTNLSEIKYYRFAKGEVGGRRAILSRTGYTGEDGFELYVDPQAAPGIWDLLLDSGRADGLIPAGLGARDTLRLEAAMALYGHEIDAETTPLEAGLEWAVKLDKGDFLGRDALLAQREAGVPRQLIGYEITGRGIARQGHEVFADGRAVGKVTSGTYSPTFEKALGMAMIERGALAEGADCEVDVRGKRIAARVAPLPFYRRAKTS
ncbi:MAG: glycine cleavage system aminomethyltransferase GcvT [Acidobacteriota bacterium]